MASQAFTAEQTDDVKKQHLLDLIQFKKEAKERIDELEASLRTLKPASMKVSLEEMVECTKQLHPHYSLINKESKENVNLAQVAMWNNELIEVVDKLQKALHNSERNAREEIASLTHEIERQENENARLVHQNEKLKERVANTVLQRRWANRIELAAEKITRAEQLRNAGLRRLESMEESLMEAHDDVYHIQRFDAVEAPQRDVCFVFHYVSNLTFPLQGTEEAWINVCRVLMLQCQRNDGGHYLGFYRGMQVFVFQDPLVALQFSGNCHLQMLDFRPPEKESLPHFRTISDDTGTTILYRGPRLHTCIFSCTPEVMVDPVSGQSSYFGPEVKASVSAAFQFSPVGEIVANKRWAQLVCRQQRYMTDSNVVVKGDAADVRDSLGKDLWDVKEMPGAGGIVCSIVPKKLKARRSIDPYALHPSPRFPCMDIDLNEGVSGIIRCLKKATDTQSKVSGNSGHQPWSGSSSNLSLKESSMNSDSLFSGPMLMMQYFIMRQKKERITTLYLDLQRSLQHYECDLMAREDRFEISNRSPLDPSETVYVCTVDFGNAAFWKSLVVPTMTTEGYMSLRETIRSYIHTQGKMYYGFLMNGNDVDIFTYVFREVSSAFSFVSDVYIMVNRHGTKCSHATQGSGQDIYFLRAGITTGPMSSIYRVKASHGSQSVKCTGGMIRLSGALCDLAQNGEILATEDVISIFLSANENLLDAQFNIVRQGGQFLYSSVSSTAIHSILPKPFAYRRKHLIEVGKDGRHPSQSVVMALGAQRTEYPKIMVESLLNQLLERQERMEASLMTAEDNRENLSHELKNPWIVTTQATIPKPPFGSPHNQTSSTPPITFFYCNIRGIHLLEKALSSSLLQTVYGKYNFFVQKVIAEMGGYVAKTNGSTAYMVVFRSPESAVEAALALQKMLSDTWWPGEVSTLEASLSVKNPKTGALVFHGPRVQVAVHTSSHYTWKRMSDPAPHSAMDFTGQALDELYYLGCQANGGEIRLSRQCVEAMTSSSAKLLLHQIAMVELPPTNISNLSGIGSPTTLSHLGFSFKSVHSHLSTPRLSFSKSFHSSVLGGSTTTGSLVASTALANRAGSSIPVTLEAFTVAPLSLEGRLEFFTATNPVSTTRRRQSKLASNSSLNQPQPLPPRKRSTTQGNEEEKGEERGVKEDVPRTLHHSLPSLFKGCPSSTLQSVSTVSPSASPGDGESSESSQSNRVEEAPTPVPPLRRRGRRKGGLHPVRIEDTDESASSSNRKSRKGGITSFTAPENTALSKTIPSLPAAPLIPLEKDNWYFKPEGAFKALPPAREGPPGRRRGSTSSLSSSTHGSLSIDNARSGIIPGEAREIQVAAERLLNKFSRDLAITWDPNATLRSWPPLETPYLNFMRLAREMVSHLVRAFTMINDKAKPPALPKITIPKSSSQKGVPPPIAGLPSLSSGAIGGIPAAPPLTKSQKNQKNVCSTALEYLDDALKFLSKLHALQKP